MSSVVLTVFLTSFAPVVHAQESTQDGLICDHGFCITPKLLKQIKRGHKLTIVHMSFMLLAWLIIFPLGILIARYSRTLIRTLPPHSLVQYIGLFTLFVGFFFGIGGTVLLTFPHFQSTHQKLGMVIFFLVIAQVIFGAISHSFKHVKRIRAVALVHMPLGLILFGLAIWNIHLGFRQYMPIAPAYASYIVYAWAAVLATVYVVGFYNVKRELQDRRNESQEQIDAKTSHAPFSPTLSP